MVRKVLLIEYETRSAERVRGLLPASDFTRGRSARWRRGSLGLHVFPVRPGRPFGDAAAAAFGRGDPGDPPQGGCGRPADPPDGLGLQGNQQEGRCAARRRLRHPGQAVRRPGVPRGREAGCGIDGRRRADDEDRGSRRRGGLAPDLRRHLLRRAPGRRRGGGAACAERDASETGYLRRGGSRPEDARLALGHPRRPNASARHGGALRRTGPHALRTAPRRASRRTPTSTE